MDLHQFDISRYIPKSSAMFLYFISCFDSEGGKFFSGQFPLCSGHNILPMLSAFMFL